MSQKLLFLLIAVCCSTHLVHSQLYVGSNGYMFVKNELVFVNQDIDIQNNGVLYLRNEAQLLQGTNATSTNKGLGKLSVFQEGTSDNFDYNYWCSPVGNASAAAGNENFGITLLHVPTSATTSNPATIVTGFDGAAGAASLSIASYWIWKFLSGVNYSEWVQTASATTIASGQGFTMKGTAGTDPLTAGEATVNNPGGAQRYDFRGKPNDGTITVNVAADKYTLTGNPYPSALHVNAFLLDPSNTDCTGIAYYWEQDKTVNSHVLTSYQGGYGTYSPIGTGPTTYGVYVPATFNSYNNDGTLNITGATSGLAIQRKYAPIGQGFMIKGKATGTPVAVSLKNTHRSYYKEADVYSQFERGLDTDEQIKTENATADQLAVIRLNTIMNNQFTKQLALVFLPTATDGVDRGIDALSPTEEGLANDVYFVLDEKKYVIQGTNFELSKRIPIGVKAGNSCSFTFGASLVENVEANQPIYLYDSADGSYHDIKNNAYTLVLAEGVYNNRFQITFTTTLSNNPVAVNSAIVISNLDHLQTIKVTNPTAEGIQSIAIYDLSGKQLVYQSPVGNEHNYSFSTSGFANGLYIVEVKTLDNQQLVQKILVGNPE
ncbi:MAG: hypothetical protein RIT03_1668 [Bacteroidota bacterium]